MIDLSQYDHIPTVRYRERIKNVCKDLKKIENIDRICMCLLFEDNKKLFISNMPEWAAEYHKMGGTRGDEVFEVSTYSSQSYFFPRRSKYDYVQKGLVLVEEEKFGHFDTYSIFRKGIGCSAIFLAVHDKPVFNQHELYQQSIKRFQKFSLFFLEELIDIVKACVPEHINTRFLLDKEHRSLVISGHLLKEIFGLSETKKTILEYLKRREPVSSIAAKIGLREKTVKNYIQSIMEQLCCNSREELLSLV